MKSALIAAIVAAIVSSGATYAATRIDGRTIALHSIPANRLTSKASKSFTSAGKPRALAAAVNSTIDYEQTTSNILFTPQTFTVSCPAGDVAVGGGYRPSDNLTSGGAIQDSVTPDFTGWSVTLTNTASRNDGTTPTLTVYVSCEPTVG
jgi:hypothetical protein